MIWSQGNRDFRFRLNSGSNKNLVLHCFFDSSSRAIRLIQQLTRHLDYLYLLKMYMKHSKAIQQEYKVKQCLAKMLRCTKFMYSKIFMFYLQDT